MSMTPNPTTRGRAPNKTHGRRGRAKSVPPPTRRSSRERKATDFGEDRIDPALAGAPRAQFKMLRRGQDGTLCTTNRYKEAADGKILNAEGMEEAIDHIQRQKEEAEERVTEATKRAVEAETELRAIKENMRIVAKYQEAPEDDPRLKGYVEREVQPAALALEVAFTEYTVRLNEKLKEIFIDI
ncbi:hypothetical protein ACHAXT_013068 [Thalassiosira profunda]